MSEWHPIETVPNNVVDVLAKYWDAGLDKFLVQRFTGVFLQDGVWVWSSPFVGDEVRCIDLVKMGYKPYAWAHIPVLQLPDTPF